MDTVFLTLSLTYIVEMFGGYATPTVPMRKRIQPQEQHQRIVTEKGPVHVWKPSFYRRKGAGVVVFFHGYYTDVDKEWGEAKLAAQYRKSGQNALFITPASTQNERSDVIWNSFAELETALKKARITLPPGPVVIVGHSGAFRTVAQMVTHPKLRTVILLDALYGYKTRFESFARLPGKRLVLVSSSTLEEATSFVQRFRKTITLEAAPRRLWAFTPREQRTPLLHIVSQYGHFDMVNGGHVLPSLLALSFLTP